MPVLGDPISKEYRGVCDDPWITQTARVWCFICNFRVVFRAEDISDYQVQRIAVHAWNAAAKAWIPDAESRRDGRGSD